MARYESNRKEFAKIKKSRMVHNPVRDAARDGANYLKQAVNTRSGNYARSVSVESGWDILKKDRVAAFIVADNEYATALEVGSWNIKDPPRPMEETLKYLRAKYDGKGE